MIDLLYRILYRRERRERLERGAAVAEVWRRRQMENDRLWAENTARLRALREAVKAASTWDEKIQLLEDFRPVSRRMEDT